MAWEHFLPDEPVPRFMLYLQDRDLWRWEMDDSHEINAAIRSHPMEFKVWEQMSGLWREERFGAVMTNALVSLREQGAACLRVERQYAEKLAGQHQWAELDTELQVVRLYPRRTMTLDRPAHPDWASHGIYRLPAVNTPVLQSEVCHLLLEQYPAVELSACYATDDRGLRVWSLRSRGAVDCSAIAAAFGGGGHARAAGFEEEA